jgi:hypothetical protein
MQIFNGSRQVEEQFGPESRCFMVSNLDRGAQSPQEPVCLRANCTEEGMWLLPTGSTASALCRFGKQVCGRVGAMLVM